LAKLYHAGLGVPQDTTRALALFEQAATDNKPEHIHDLALALEGAATEEPTLSRAVSLYRQAAEAGFLEAQVNLAVMLQEGRGTDPDAKEAARLYATAAEQGHPRAMNNLGLLHVRGDGLPQDYTRAAALFAQAAELGLKEAMTNLGVLYENGFGVPQSDDIAADLYRRGGRSGGSPSDVDLMYDTRLAPPPQDEQGMRLLAIAAEAGDPVAQFQLAWLLLSPEANQPRRAATLMERAAKNGHGPSMANLGILYFQGRGVPQDYVLAQMWLLLAGSTGVNQAPGINATFARKMTSHQINEAQKRAAILWESWKTKKIDVITGLRFLKVRVLRVD
jgi:TPR repeat protein